MVKGGTNCRKQAGQRRKTRKGPARKVPVSGDIEMVSETDADLSNTNVVDDGEIPGPSNAGISASEKKLSGATEENSDSINVDISINPDGSRIHSSPLFYETGILTVYDIFKLQLCIFVFKCLNHYNPSQFSNYYSYVSDHYNTSSSRTKLLRTPMVRTSKYGLNSIKYLGAKIWNDIPLELREGSSANLFKTILKRHLLSSYIDSIVFLH